VLADNTVESPLEIKPSEEDLNNERLNSWTAFERRVYKDYLKSTSYMGAKVATLGVSVSEELDSLMA
jgi:hypothetical protein